MNKEIRNKILVFVISILILTGIIYGGYKLLIGRDGLMNKINSVESEFDKNEVLEKITDLVKENYIEVYNEIKENPDTSLEDAYNVDVAISKLVSQNILEYYYYSSNEDGKYIYTLDNVDPENTLKRDDIFYIKVNSINQDSTKGRGNKFLENDINKKDVFILEKKIENDVSIYEIKYFNDAGIEEVVGKVELENPLIK